LAQCQESETLVFKMSSAGFNTKTTMPMTYSCCYDSDMIQLELLGFSFMF